MRTVEGQWHHPEIQRLVTRVAKGDSAKEGALRSAVDYLGAVVTYPTLEDKLPVPEAFEHPLFARTSDLTNEYPGRALRRTLQKIKEQEEPHQTPSDTLLTLQRQRVIAEFIIEEGGAVRRYEPSPKIKRPPFVSIDLLARRFGLPVDTTSTLLNSVVQSSGDYLEAQAVLVLSAHLRSHARPEVEVPIQPLKHNWIADPDPEATIHEEVRTIISQRGDLDREDLHRRKLYYAVYRYYPGQYVQLRWDFGLPLAEKPKGYWTLDRIRHDINTIVREHGRFTESLALQLGREDLVGAIDRLTSEGIPHLLQDMGLRPAQTRRSADQVEEEALGVWLRFGDLSDKHIKTVKGLYAAIARKSEGKFKGIRERIPERGRLILEEAYAENERRNLK